MTGLSVERTNSDDPTAQFLDVSFSSGPGEVITQNGLR